MGTPSDQTALWNAADAAQTFTHPLALERFAREAAGDAQRNLVREFKRVPRPGGLMLISDYPLQSDRRNLERHDSFTAELGTCGAFRLPEGAVLRHHRRNWFAELRWATKAA
jgi:hypothetical protein